MAVEIHSGCRMALGQPMMDAESYRRLQLTSVTGHGGTDELEILKVTSSLIFTTLLWKVYDKPNIGHKRYIFDFFLLIAPQIVLFCYPQWSQWLFMTVLLCTLPYISSPQKIMAEGLKRKVNNTTSKLLPFWTNARAAITIMCLIGILAVDFNVFPRRFAKTEEYGISLMDVGVGCVVASMGITAGRPLFGGSRRQSWFRTAKSTLPLLILGLMRMLLVKVINYQEHISEYGVHWNFFVTLGILPIVMHIAFMVINARHSFWVGLLLGGIYQWTLSTTSLETFIIAGHRKTFFAMNKEGIVSIWGYLALSLMSVGVGKDIFSGSKNEVQIAKRLFPKLLLLGGLYIFLRYGLGLAPSRRLVCF